MRIAKVKEKPCHVRILTRRGITIPNTAREVGQVAHGQRRANNRKPRNRCCPYGRKYVAFSGQGSRSTKRAARLRLIGDITGSLRELIGVKVPLPEPTVRLRPRAFPKLR
jgi:hypothetical protein